MTESQGIYSSLGPSPKSVAIQHSSCSVNIVSLDRQTSFWLVWPTSSLIALEAQILWHSGHFVASLQVILRVIDTLSTTLDTLRPRNLKTSRFSRSFNNVLAFGSNARARCSIGCIARPFLFSITQDSYSRHARLVVGPA